MPSRPSPARFTPTPSNRPRSPTSATKQRTSHSAGRASPVHHRGSRRPGGFELLSRVKVLGTGHGLVLTYGEPLMVISPPSPLKTRLGSCSRCYEARSRSRRQPAVKSRRRCRSRSGVTSSWLAAKPLWRSVPVAGRRLVRTNSRRRSSSSTLRWVRLTWSCGSGRKGGLLVHRRRARRAPSGGEHDRHRVL